MAKISDLIRGVQRKLANRTDVPANAPFWIQDAIRELTTNYPFEELQTFGPSKALTANQARYDMTFFTNNNELPSMMLSPQVFVDYPSNTISTTMFYREPSVVLPISRVFTLPKFWTRVGMQVVLGPGPDRNYQVEWAYQKRHKFEDDLKSTEIRMPEDWLEIVEYSAAYRGAIELRLPDFVVLHHQTLFGDPKDPGNVGLIKSRESQHEKDKKTSPGALVPTVNRSTP